MPILLINIILVYHVLCYFKNCSLHTTSDELKHQKNIYPYWNTVSWIKSICFTFQRALRHQLALALWSQKTNFSQVLNPLLLPIGEIYQ